MAVLRTILILFFVSGITSGCRQSDKIQSQESGNQLAQAGSPYLREHADNPVNWYEWGPEALEKAKSENKPMIISIGYASCHWCHVMEEESFMDTAVARIMNENFVSIKIDREERPDVDQIYLNAAQLISGNAGWPLNAFTLPDAKPFYAGTYSPKAQWLQMLHQITDAYKNKHSLLTQQAQELTAGIQNNEAISVPAHTTHGYDEKTFEHIFSSFEKNLDYTSGGFVGAPKFPMAACFEFLLQYHHSSGNKKALRAVNTTLDAMSKGGIYDQLGGGFSRYTTDDVWMIPHFEKMLYDNGQLVSLYAHAYQVTKDTSYYRVITETLTFIKNEMTSPEGGFYSSINADSEGREGAFYVWSAAEIRNVVDDDMETLVMEYYQATDSGNWEDGKNILYRKSNAREFATSKRLSPRQFEKNLQENNRLLLEARNKRIRPSLDDKILTSWNAIMLKGYVDAYLALGEEDYLEASIKNARFLEKNMLRADGGLWRSFVDNKAGIEAFLDDYAMLAKAFIHLYQATFDKHWLEISHQLAAYALKNFSENNSGLFYYTRDGARDLVARKMELSDNAIPSSNSVMAEVLYLLGQYYSKESYLERSKTMLNHIYPELMRNGQFYGNWLSFLGRNVFSSYEVALVGDDAVMNSIQMQKHYLPQVIFLGGSEENLPLLENKYVRGKTVIYVCQNKTCKLPVMSVDKALAQLKAR
jgi:uncharacterized protein YyaL (SSP411 family)